MRAFSVTEYGAAPAVAEIPTPEPGPGQVLIELRAAGMNPMDGPLASGAWKPMSEEEVAQVSDRWPPYRSLAVSYLFASEYDGQP